MVKSGCWDFYSLSQGAIRTSGLFPKAEGVRTRRVGPVSQQPTLPHGTTRTVPTLCNPYGPAGVTFFFRKNPPGG